MSLNPEQFGTTWTQGPLDRHKREVLTPAPSHVYRVAHRAEYEEAQKTGMLKSKWGEVHTSVRPETTYAGQGSVHEPTVLMQIHYDQDSAPERWRAKQTMTANNGYAVARAVPLERIKLIGDYPDAGAARDGIKRFNDRRQS